MKTKPIYDMDGYPLCSTGCPYWGDAHECTHPDRDDAGASDVCRPAVLAWRRVVMEARVWVDEWREIRGPESGGHGPICRAVDTLRKEVES